MVRTILETKYHFLIFCIFSKLQIITTYLISYYYPIVEAALNIAQEADQFSHAEDVSINLIDFINEGDTEANGPAYYYYKVINKLDSCKYDRYMPTRSHESMKKKPLIFDTYFDGSQSELRLLFLFETYHSAVRQ